MDHQDPSTSEGTTINFTGSSVQNVSVSAAHQLTFGHVENLSIQSSNPNILSADSATRRPPSVQADHPTEAKLPKLECSNTDAFERKLMKRTRKRLTVRMKFISCGDDDGPLTNPKETKNVQLRKHNLYKGQPTTQQKPHKSSSTLNFLDPQPSDGESIEIQELFSGGKRFAAVVGGPGSGKTTLVQKFGDMVLKGNISDLNQIDMIHFISVHELDQSNNRTLSELLFQAVCPENVTLVAEWMNWLKQEENQSCFMLILDGLDQAEGWSMNKPYHLVGYDEKAKCPALLYSLFEGHLLPNIKILATSRNHGILDYVECVRPDTTISLIGFKRSDAQYLFEEMVGEKGKEIWQSASETVKTLCCTPLLLVYTAVNEMDSPSRPVESISSIMMGLLQNIVRQETSLDNMKVVDKLKKFCLSRIEKQLVSFTQSDLSEYTLEAQEIRNLSISVPTERKGVIERRILQEDVNMFFSHQLILEATGALGFLELPLDEFGNFVEKHLGQPHFATLRQLACGILMNQATRDIAGKLFKGGNVSEKKDILRKHLTHQLNTNMNTLDKLHLIASIHECGNEFHRFLKSKLHEISLIVCILTMCDVQIISGVIAACSELSQMELCDCNIDALKLEVLSKCLLSKESNVEIHSLALASNELIGPQGMEFIGKIVEHCRVKELDLHSCQLRENHISSFLKQVRGNVEMDVLQFSGNYKLGAKGMELVGEVIQSMKVETLDVSCCDVTGEVLQSLRQDFTHLKKLVIGKNTQLGEIGMRFLGQLVATSQLQELHVNWCELTHPQLLAFEESLRTSHDDSRMIKLLGLNISNNKNTSDPHCLDTLCRIVVRCNVERMDVHGCGFSEDQKKVLKHCKTECEAITGMTSGQETNSKTSTKQQSTRSQKSQEIQFVRMDNYRSMKLGSEDFQNLLQKNRGRYLDVSLRNTTPDLLETLPDAIASSGAKFKKLCLSEGRKASEEDIDVFVKSLEHISEELWLGEWEIEKKFRKNLQDGLNALESPNSQKLEIHFSVDDKMKKEV